MKSLISFIDEGAEDKTEKYKVVVLTRTPEVSENVKVFKTSERICDENRNAESYINNPGFSTPLGSNVLFIAFNDWANSSGRCSSYHGRWSRPTA